LNATPLTHPERERPIPALMTESALVADLFWWRSVATLQQLEPKNANAPRVWNIVVFFRLLGLEQ